VLRRAAEALLVAASVLVICGGPSATAASNGLTMTGTVGGGLHRGGVAVLRLRAVEPGGYEHLETMQVTMVLHDLVLAQITYLPDFQSVTIRGGQLVRVGTPGRLDGSFFSFTGLDVTTTAGGDQLTLTLRVHVDQDVPPQAIFRLSATNHEGGSAVVTRSVPAANAPPQKAPGFSWGSLAAAVVAALFAGSFLGGLFVSRRSVPPKVDVYEAITTRIQRIEQERVPT
jgi:hypothetical protein